MVGQTSKVLYEKNSIYVCGYTVGTHGGIPG